jgi:hypothetical protein
MGPKSSTAAGFILEIVLKLTDEYNFCRDTSAPYDSGIAWKGRKVVECSLVGIWQCGATWLIQKMPAFEY